MLPIARLSYQHATTDASDVKVEFAARRAGDPADLVAACDRAHSTLKWQPRFDDLTNHCHPRVGMGAQATKRLPAPFDANPARNDGDPLTASGESVAIR